jgi:hypothetical protein
MVVNAPTASRATFLRRTVVNQLTVDKLKKGLPGEKGERAGGCPAARNAEQHRVAPRNLQPKRRPIVRRVLQARPRSRAIVMWGRRSARAIAACVAEDSPVLRFTRTNQKATPSRRYRQRTTPHRESRH